MNIFRRTLLMLSALLLIGLAGVTLSQRYDQLRAQDTVAQQDSAGDGIHDNCPDQPGPPENDGCPTDTVTVEPDTDADRVPDQRDNCPNDQNPNQENADGDKFGDVCDRCPTVYDDENICAATLTPVPPTPIPFTPTPTLDTDGDGILDHEDDCDTVPGAPDHPDPNRRGCPLITDDEANQIITTCSLDSEEEKKEIANLDPELLEIYRNNLDTLCALLRGDATTVDETIKAVVTDTCPEYLPLLYHAFDRMKIHGITAPELSAEELSARACDVQGLIISGDDDGSVDMKKRVLVACFVTQNITQERISRLETLVEQWGVTLDGEALAEDCEVVRLINNLGHLDDDEATFNYGDLLGNCLSAPTEALSRIYKATLDGVSLSETAANGIDFCNVEGGDIPPGSRLSDDELNALLDETRGALLVECARGVKIGYLTHIEYANPPLTEADVAAILNQPNACHAVRDYVRTGIIPRSFIESASVDETEVSHEGGEIIGSGVVLQGGLLVVTDEINSAVLYRFTYNPEFNPEKLTETPPLRTALLPSISPNDLYIAFVEETQGQINLISLFVPEGVTVVRKSSQDFTIATNRMAWDTEDLVFTINKDNRTQIVTLPADTLRGTPTLLIDNAQSPTISYFDSSEQQSHHDVANFIAYHDLGDKIIRWGPLSAVIRESGAFKGREVPGSKDCFDPAYGRNATYIFMVCMRDRHQTIERFDTGKGQLLRLWTAPNAEFTINNLEARQGKDKITFDHNGEIYLFNADESASEPEIMPLNEKGYFGAVVALSAYVWGLTTE